MVVREKSKAHVESRHCACSLISTSVALNHIPYVDFPEIKIDAHESTEMPFRYVKDHTGNPIMPEVHVTIPDS